MKTTRARKLAGWMLGCALATSTATASATLIERGGGMIYDTVLGITWLANATLAAGTPFDDGDNTSDGRLTFTSAVAWADALVYGGYSDWRLRKVLQPDPSCSGQFNAGPSHPPQGFGFNCVGSELGRHFDNNLGGNMLESVLSATGDTAAEITNLALFSNVQAFVYWFGEETAFNASLAWLFGTQNGRQDFNTRQNELYAWAVRSGDVPLPGTLALLGLGLTVLGASRRGSVPAGRVAGAAG